MRIIHAMPDDRSGDGSALRIPTHALLVAGVAVRQAATRTAQVAGRRAARAAASDPLHALVATFLHADAAAATAALGGSFHPKVARRAGEVARENTVNSPFTLAF